MSSPPSYTEFAKSSVTPAFFSKMKSAVITRVFGAKPPSPTHRNLNKAGCYDPYALSVTNSAAMSEEEGSEASSFPPSPASIHGTPVRFASCPPSTFHHALWNQMELIRLPEIAPVDMFVPVTPYSLFIGQVRFETTAAELRWIIRRVSNVLPVKAEQRGNGCFVVFFRSAEDLDAVRRLHKRILFDHSGVWFAKTQQEVEVLFDYGMRALPFVPRWSHLPRDCMTVEDTKVCNAAQQQRFPPASFWTQSQQQFQQQQMMMMPSVTLPPAVEMCYSLESILSVTSVAGTPACVSPTEFAS